MILTDLGYYILLCLFWVVIFVIFCAICGFFIYRFIDWKLRACPNCKRGASGMITNTEIEPLGMKIDHTGRKPMRVKSEKVTDYFECTHCDHTWIRTYERKERIPLDKHM